MADPAPWRRQQESTNPTSYGGEVPQIFVPPPPPPPGPGNIPNKRLQTEIPERRLKEPPACVQNAMMTKDKKPFTYTPGGLDLSQIRSPRMARRISRNANSEGVCSAPPQASPGAAYLPPSALAAMQPQLPIQVFPTGPSGLAAGPPPPPPPPPALDSNGVQKPVQQNLPSPVPQQIKIPANPTAMLRPTQRTTEVVSPPQDEYVPKPQLGSLYIPPIERSDASPPIVVSKTQLGSLYIPPITEMEKEAVRNNVQSPIRSVQSPKASQSPQLVQSPVPNLNKAPTPWLTQRQISQQQEVPPWLVREEFERAQMAQSPQMTQPVQMVAQPVQQRNVGTRIVPIQIEGRESSTQQTQVRKIEQANQVRNVVQTQTQSSSTQNTNVRIIPIQIEGASDNQQRQNQQMRNFASPSGNVQYHTMPKVGQNVPMEQMRKLDLTDDDRELMNKFRNQVDVDSFLHNEPDPRYRGAAIPSKAFRMLQTMTDTMSSPLSETSPVPPGNPQVNRVQQVRQTSQDDGAYGLQQPYIHPSEQQVPEPKKYTGAAIPSRSFRILQAMTSPENCANTTSLPNDPNGIYTNDPNQYQWGYNPNYPPHPYWNNPYWGYYNYPTPTSELSGDSDGEQTNTDENTQYQQYWGDPYMYYGYYGYMYPPPVYPQEQYIQNADEDTAGYSSNDEMAFYGARFANGVAHPPTPATIEPQSETEELITLSNEESKNSSETELPSDETVNESEPELPSDCELEEKPIILSKSGAMLFVNSATEVNAFDDTESRCSEASEDSSDTDDTTEENKEDDVQSVVIENEEFPHQLSVIFEESECSEMTDIIKSRKNSIATTISEDDSSSTIGNDNSDEENNEEKEETTFTVKLPLKFQFSRTDNDEPVTTVFVGNTESTKDVETHVTLKSPILHPSPSDGDVSVSLTVLSCNNSCNDMESKFRKDSASCDDLFYETAESDSEVSVSISLSRRKIPEDEKITENNAGIELEQFSDSDEDSDDSSSVSSEDSTSSSDSFNRKEIQRANTQEDVPLPLYNEDCEIDNIAILKAMKEQYLLNRKSSESIAKSLKYENSDKSKVNYTKGAEDMSDEEVDSGVTSDMSRHISETDTESECFPELRKMTKYQRAATHSRLFKLLQDECGTKSETDEENTSEDGVENITKRKERLTLPLNKLSAYESSESEAASPTSPTVCERLVKELVQSLLQQKKGRSLRHLPYEKLRAAAIRILREEMMESTNSQDSVFLSPDISDTMTSSQTPTSQELYYNDYCDYYNTWANAEYQYEPEYNILPSKAFRLLQGSGMTIAKCPRVLSSKNVRVAAESLDQKVPLSPVSCVPQTPCEARTT